jgi:multiple antibiotic resistance protein
VHKIVQDALFLLTTVDPIGTLLLFSALTAELSERERRSIAARAIFYSGIIMLGALIVGQLVLQELGIKLISLQTAGGMILFLFGLQMIFGDSSQVTGGQPEAGHDLAVFPLAVPSIAGPGAIMAVILLPDNHMFSTTQQVGTAAVMLGVLGLTYLMLRFSTPLLRVLGINGSRILIRVLGMLLAALAVEMFMQAMGVARWATGS